MLQMDRTNKIVEFFTVYDGTKIIVLKAVVNSANDLPRLHRLAKDMLSELTWLGIKN